MHESDILVVADAFGIDTNVYVAGTRRGAETTFARTTDGLGQAGCYGALAAAALGVTKRAIAALGDDRLGLWVRDALTAAGVAVTELRDPQGTHRSVNLVTDDGTRRNFLDPRGVSETHVEPDVCREAMRGARLLHCHLEDWCREVLPIAAEEGLIVSCDLQHVVDLDDPYRTDFVAASDLLFLSAANLDDPRSAAAELASRRDGRIVGVGNGAEGCLVAHADRVEHYRPAELPRAVVDTNGAGDNLAVGFIVAHLLDGLPIDRAITRAQLAARWICTLPGDRKAPLSRAALDTLEAEAF